MAIEIHIDDGYAAALFAAGLNGFESLMRCRRGTPVSVHEDRSATRLEVEVDGRRRELYLKRTLRQPATDLVRDLLLGRKPQARPVWEYTICKRLEALGIPVMKAVGCGQRKRLLLPREGFVLVEAAPVRMTLEKAWRDRADGRPRLAPRERRRVIRAVAKVVARLHDAGFRWPDLVGKHILLEAPETAEATRNEWRLCLIDLERVETSRSEKLRQRDLTHLLKSMPARCVSRSDLLRFAMAYCGCEESSKPDRRRLIRQRFAWAARRLTRRSAAARKKAAGRPG